MQAVMQNGFQIKQAQGEKHRREDTSNICDCYKNYRETVESCQIMQLHDNGRGL